MARTSLDAAPQPAALERVAAPPRVAKPTTEDGKNARKTAKAVKPLPKYKNPSKDEIRKMLTEAAQRNGIPPEIVMAIAFKESEWRQFDNNGDPLRGRWSPSDQGIMQINQDAHPAAFPRARTDIVYNIEYGAGYFKELYVRYGTWPEAVSAYNYGSARRDLATKKFMNQQYVDKVYFFATDFKKALGENL